MCNHINKQFVNIQGQLEDLKCDLPDDHVGDHHAKYEALRLVEGIKDPRRKSTLFNGKDYYIEELDGFWTDAAGKSIFEYQEEMAEKRRLLDAFKEANPGRGEEYRQKARELGLIPSVRA